MVTEAASEAPSGPLLQSAGRDALPQALQCVILVPQARERHLWLLFRSCMAQLPEICLPRLRDQNDKVEHEHEPDFERHNCSSKRKFAHTGCDGGRPATG